jgi:hypothetical protein
VFQISALDRHEFDELFSLDDDALAARGARRYVADKKPGFPCRVSLQDAEPGERLILLPYPHQPADSPYRAAGPIFVRESAATSRVAPDTIPELLRSRLLSVRAYDAAHLMIAADVVDGRELESSLASVFGNDRVAYAHIHFARPGCFACRVDRHSHPPREDAGNVQKSGVIRRRWRTSKNVRKPRTSSSTCSVSSCEPVPIREASALVWRSPNGWWNFTADASRFTAMAWGEGLSS